MSSEFARIALIEALLKQPGDQVSLGIGDDCAVLAASPHPRVWTVDTASEDVHFTRGFMTLEQAGYRAFMAAASDLAAMGARPVAALSAWTLPAAFSDAELVQVAQGLARASAACGCPIVGGNLARAQAFTLTTSVLGECPRRVLTRAGASVGDGVYLTGPVGGAALGLLALQQERATDPRFAAMIACYREPRARLDVALALADLATAAIDVSDGVAQDLSHLCRASGVGAEIDAHALPLLPEFHAGAAALGKEPYALALSGGEDYEVLFTAAEPVPPSLATRIGTITALSGRLVVHDAQGRELPTTAGFDHFDAD